MIRRPPRSTLSSSSAASDVYKRQGSGGAVTNDRRALRGAGARLAFLGGPGSRPRDRRRPCRSGDEWILAGVAVPFPLAGVDLLHSRHVRELGLRAERRDPHRPVVLGTVLAHHHLLPRTN